MADAGECWRIPGRTGECWKSPNLARRVRLLGKADNNALCGLQVHLASHDDLYPGIEAWFARRVRPGIASGERRVWVIENENDERVVGETIVKLKGNAAKLCSMYVPIDLRGTTFASQFLYEVLRNIPPAKSRSIHFTIGEDSAQAHAGYFERWGFVKDRSVASRYRLGVDEWSYRADGRQIASALFQYLRGKNPADRTTLDPPAAWGEALRARGARVSERQMELFPHTEIFR